MSELRFNCPNCGQHLSGDSSYAGQRVSCPSCQTQVVVPPPVPGATLAQGVPPMPGVRPQMPSPAPQKTSGLAIASLVCSIGSFLIIPFGFIPGIICGHMAKGQMDRTPGLQGRGLAKAGLIVGYISLGLHVLVVCGVVALFFFVRAAAPTARTHSSSRTVQSHRAAPVEAETTDTQPDGSGWTLQLADAEIPATAVTGRIHGQPFKLEKVSLEAGFLKFMEGTDFFADREMDVVIFESDPHKLSGRSFVVPKQEFGNNPHIYMRWKESEPSGANQKSYTDKYALRLEFGELAGGKLPGKIYLCTPDQAKSFIRGTFELPVKGTK
jgi:hypothetical protein